LISLLLSRETVRWPKRLSGRAVIMETSIPEEARLIATFISLPPILMLNWFAVLKVEEGSVLSLIMISPKVISLIILLLSQHFCRPRRNFPCSFCLLRDSCRHTLWQGHCRCRWRTRRFRSIQPY